MQLTLKITRSKKKLPSYRLCVSVLSVDAMDVSGEQQIDVDHHLWKQRIDLQGNKINDPPEKEGKAKNMSAKGYPTNSYF